ncbi:MAG TPA: NAD(P)H-dependent oxidoreductase [Bacteroidia bacterium]|jgi:chromate reductase|nr:NAD(P)H-dependent oxidoreductase [Bacteroidia bacterium]
MYTIISATHRKHSNTLKIAHVYLQLLQDQGIEVKLLSLEDLPPDFVFSDTFGHRTERFQQIMDTYLVHAGKFILLAPEYNGGIPGILSAFIDATGPEVFKGKKVALVGVASGRGGNARGLDYLSNCFQYMGVYVYHRLLPVSQILTLQDEHGKLKEDLIRQTLQVQMEGFLEY